MDEQPITADQIQSEASPKEAQWRSRIVGYGTEDPEQLLAHPENWRVHPAAQKKALTQLLDKVGWVQNVVVNQTTGHVLDGHLRVGEAIARSEPEVPVTYVDLTEEEEKLILASLDPVAQMAVSDQPTLMSLLSQVDVDGELDALLRRTAGMSAGAAPSVSQDQVDDAQSLLDERSGSNQGSQDLFDIECPHCGETVTVDRSVLAK